MNYTLSKIPLRKGWKETNELNVNEAKVGPNERSEAADELDSELGTA